MPVKTATMPEKPRAGRRRIREDSGIQEDAGMIGGAPPRGPEILPRSRG
jgi:hypothetical protein